jgi:hypothetical protein
MVHGAENDASGVIALLAAAAALGEVKRNVSKIINYLEGPVIC